MSDGRSPLNFANRTLGPGELLAETDLMLRKTIEAYRVTPATSPLKALTEIMHECHDVIRVLLLRLGQNVLDQPALLEAFDRVISSGSIDATHKDRWVTNTRAVAEVIAKKHPALKPALLSGIAGDVLLCKELHDDVVTEITKVFELFMEPVAEEPDPDPWLQAAANMTQRPLPVGPQPTYTPPSIPVQPSRSAAGKKKP